MKYFRRPNLPFISICVISVLIMLLTVVIAGCDPGTENDLAAADQSETTGGALVPAGVAEQATPDSLPVESSPIDATSVVEKASDTGTLTSSERVTGSVKLDDPAPSTETTPIVEVVEVNSTGDYSLQLGSFRQMNAAQRRVASIRELGYKPVVETVEVGGLNYHRVLIRGLATKEDASSLGEQLHAQLNITYLIRRRS